jgi:hypothetical protein
MNTILIDYLDSFYLAYVNDILIFSKNKKEYR